MSAALKELAHLAGIHDDFWDQTGIRHETSPETARALLAAMGLPATTDAEAEATLATYRAELDACPLPDWLILEPEVASQQTLSHPVRAARLLLEDGTEQTLPATTPLAVPALPLGIHQVDLDGHRTTLLVAPQSLPLPEKAWGVTLPLYGLRTEAEGGLGDYADLADAVDGLAQQGAEFVGLNPVHAGFPTDPHAFSPYSPSHRRRFATMHIALPGERLTGGDALIDYASTVAAQRAALEKAFLAFEAAGGDASFDAFVSAGGASLERFATYQSLAEIHGPYWYGWPTALTDKTSDEVAAFRTAHPGAVRFQAWLQWQAEQQLQAVADTAARRNMRYGLYLDLAVGTHPHGAETWSEGETFATGVSLGAPPDAFSPGGQVWALAPFNPHALARMAFRPLAETLRRQLKYAGLLRIDHVLGFERAFWVPDRNTAPGAYVAMPRDAMLAVVRIEAARVGATVVGEDLGNIPEGLQDALAGSGVLGCRVAMFEQLHHGTFRPPEDYTEAALASFGTHDLPTWVGWRNGRDIQVRHELGILGDADLTDTQDWRRGEVFGFDALAGSDGPDPDPMHRLIGSVRSRLVALQIEDLLGLEEQANLPGTVEVHPNWRRRMPIPARSFAKNPAIARAAKIMRESGRQE